MTKPKILIVDDDKSTREDLRDFLLPRIECEIQLREDGEAGIKALEAQEYHVLIQDLNMPGIDGFEVIKAAKERYEDISVFVITRWEDPSMTKKINDFGAMCFNKPIMLKGFLLRIKEALEEKEF